VIGARVEVGVERPAGQRQPEHREPPVGWGAQQQAAAGAQHAAHF